MKPTIEQINAIDTVVDGKSLKLIAFAGAGKTSTLQLIAEKLSDKRGLYLAFNKAIASEAQRKMPSNISAKTFHSMGYSAMPPWMMRRFQATEMHINEFCAMFHLKTIHYKASVNTYVKPKDDEAIILNKTMQKKISSYKIKRLVDLSLNSFMGSSDSQPNSKHTARAIKGDMPELIEESKEIFDSLVNLITPIIQYMWADYSSEEGNLAIGSRNHAVYFKYWSISNPIIHADFILFDEAQDADPIMLEILRQQQCQVIYVGDKHQQIYGWRGAVNALEKIRAKELYLTQSFRFGKRLADQCRPILRALGERQQLKGTNAVTEVVTQEIPNMAEYAEYNACLCRTNAEVVLTVLELASLNIPCTTNINTKGIVDTLHDMKQLQENTLKLSASTPNLPLYQTDNKKIHFHCWEEFVVYMQDFNNEPELAITFEIFTNYGIEEITKALRGAANNKGIEVTTAHKAKGMEWDNIVLQRDFIKGFFEMNQDVIRYKPLNEAKIYDAGSYIKRGGKTTDVVPIIRTGENVNAELRLLYVAITRARKKVNISLVNKVFTDFFKFNDLLIKRNDSNEDK